MLDFDHEQHPRSEQITLLIFDGIDVRLAFGNRSSNRRQHARLVVGHDLERDFEVAADLTIPGNRDEAIRLFREALRQKPDYGIAERNLRREEALRNREAP